jgi:hypothetical protein
MLSSFVPTIYILYKDQMIDAKLQIVRLETPRTVLNLFHK